MEPFCLMVDYYRIRTLKFCLLFVFVLLNSDFKREIQMTANLPFLTESQLSSIVRRPEEQQATLRTEINK